VVVRYHRLENALRNWSALTAGDVIIINYNKKYTSAQPFPLMRVKLTPSIQEL
jgi:hypothetical protein